MRNSAEVVSAASMQRLCRSARPRRIRTYPIVSRTADVALSEAFSAGRSEMAIWDLRFGFAIWICDCDLRFVIEVTNHKPGITNAKAGRRRVLPAAVEGR